MNILLNARGVGDVLGLTPERGRQLFREGKLKVAAMLNGKQPLATEAAVRALAEQRKARAAARTANPVQNVA
jgi:predicted site-specific integrase-resolvase